mgnify:CR=1 FL=1
MNIIFLIGISIVLIFKLRKAFETAKQFPNWDKVLSKVWLVSILFLMALNIPAFRFINKWYDELIYIIFFITALLLKGYRLSFSKLKVALSTNAQTDNSQFRYYHRSARHLLLALIPYGAVYCINSVIKVFTPNVYKLHYNYFSSAEAFTTVWLIGFGIYVIVQTDKDQKLRLKQEEEAQQAEIKKAALEKMIADRTIELTHQKEILEQALSDLKSTQAQLVQSEKLASLGELTAGIAHEIQNPLNFVNNFSEVSVELIQELKEEREKLKADRDEALEAELLGDLERNLHKINQHGKRASNIVKGMLEHSRDSKGEMRPTDLNALCDEYLRLAYHGMRARDKTFNAAFHTDLDPDIPEINIVPQDIGRVLLNLVNNAFQAVDEQAKKGTPNYQPQVTVRTRKLPDAVEIAVEDNGPGIPEAIKDKIFQPFFTTKPTGQGTGLGLSLSYDIVKAHGGTLEVFNQAENGATFKITFPN